MGGGLLPPPARLLATLLNGPDSFSALQFVPPAPEVLAEIKELFYTAF